jgi:Cys-rich protein (TIGR01571 family)
VVFFLNILTFSQLAVQQGTLETRECTIPDIVFNIFCFICRGVQTREKIRTKYGFGGSFGSDILEVWLCGCCAVTQQTRQLQMKGLKPAGLFMDK